MRFISLNLSHKKCCQKVKGLLKQLCLAYNINVSIHYGFPVWSSSAISNIFRLTEIRLYGLVFFRNRPIKKTQQEKPKQGQFEQSRWTAPIALSLIAYQKQLV